MKRSVALTLSVSSFALAGLALGPGDVRAGSKDKKEEEGKSGKKIERIVDRRVMFLRGRGEGGFLGIGLEEVEGDARGARVRSVAEGSAADKAGLEEGDVIVRFDGESVRSAAQLARLVQETPSGRSVPIEVERAGASRTLTATLGERPRRGLPGGDDVFGPDMDFEFDVPAPPSHPGMRLPAPGPHVFRWHDDGDDDFTMHWGPERPRRLGIRYMELEDQLADYFKLAADEGVLVTSVDEDGPAAKAGMKAGDVILELGGKPIRTGRDLRTVVAESEGGEEVAVKVQRDGRPLELRVTLAQPEKRRIRSSGISL